MAQMPSRTKNRIKNKKSRSMESPGSLPAFEDPFLLGRWPAACSRSFMSTAIFDRLGPSLEQQEMLEQRTIQIRIGYEMIYDCPQPTPMILTLNIHPTRAHDIVVPDVLTTDPYVPYSAYLDRFDNWCTRLVAPTG